MKLGFSINKTHDFSAYFYRVNLGSKGLICPSR